MTQQLPHHIPALLYQDDDLLIINKPPNLLSIPDGYDPDLPHLRSILEPEHGDLWMVHRLDKGTSGVMVLARNIKAHRFLNNAFREHSVEKNYHGLVTPVPDWYEKVITLPLKVNADRMHRTRVNHQDGKEAWSKCKVLKWFDDAVLMEIEIRTGITHQIRAHLRAFDLLLLGESLYHAGLSPQPIIVPRMMLHARSLALTHPTTSDLLKFEAPYPDDFRDVYTKLRATKGRDARI